MSDQVSLRPPIATQQSCDRVSRQRRVCRQFRADTRTSGPGWTYHVRTAHGGMRKSRMCPQAALRRNSTVRPTETLAQLKLCRLMALSRRSVNGRKRDRTGHLKFSFNGRFVRIADHYHAKREGPFWVRALNRFAIGCERCREAH